MGLANPAQAYHMLRTSCPFEAVYWWLGAGLAPASLRRGAWDLGSKSQKQQATSKAEAEVQKQKEKERLARGSEPPAGGRVSLGYVLGVSGPVIG